MTTEARRIIEAMRAQGHGSHVIARTLNERGVPTGSGVGQWWPATVQRVSDPAGWAAYMRRYRKGNR